MKKILVKIMTNYKENCDLKNKKQKQKTRKKNK